ncbi:MAG TPA: condensation domain-containing protein, partial [Candidatus Paceibacterota bacterium]|nr:condensation domain-containing protein [Candidatus Paceibacterota bacterium]
MIRELEQLAQELSVTVEVINGEVFISSSEDNNIFNFVQYVRLHKGEIVKFARSKSGESCFRIGPPAITPDLLALVDLTQEQIDRIVAGVVGGSSNVQDIYPLAPLQEGILFHHLMAQEGDPYLLWNLTSFANRDTLDRYISALDRVIARHDILRTSFVWEGLPEAVQVVWRQAPVQVEEVQLDPAEDIAAQLKSRFNPRHYRLDVRQAPLRRLFIAHDPIRDRWVMMHLFHHLSTDHVTAEVIQAEIRDHLLGRIEDLPAPSPFRNFVAQARLGVSREEHEAFFREMLGDVDETTAPFGLLDVQGDGSGIDEASLSLEPSLSQRLRAHARALGVSTASLFHVAWALVLSRSSGQRDPVFGTVLFGRMQGGEGADRSLGLFINTLPVRIRLGEKGVEQSILETHRQLAGLLHHEHASLALAQRCSRVPAPAPLFTSLFNYRYISPRTPSKARSRAFEGIKSLDGAERTNYPVGLSVNDLGVDFSLTAQTVSPLDPGRLCAMMHRALEELTEALEKKPQYPVGRLDILPASERHHVLVELNQTQAPYPSDLCVHQLFEEQVDRDPQAIAVVYGDVSLTYGELNERSNRL